MPVIDVIFYAAESYYCKHYSPLPGLGCVRVVLKIEGHTLDSCEWLPSSILTRIRSDSDEKEKRIRKILASLADIAPHTEHYIDFHEGTEEQ